MTILDRYLLTRCGAVIALAILCEAALLWAGGTDVASTGAAFVVAIGLAVVYGRLAHDGEYVALAAAGIAPRRIIAAVVATVVVVQGLFLAYEYTFERGNMPSAYIGYALSALQPVFMASSALPITVRSRAREPWAHMFLLLGGYTACLVAARTGARIAELGTGMYWFYVVPVLAIADAVLFRSLRTPPAAP